MLYLINQQKNNFDSLSVKDLLEARDLFHVHLMNKSNVIGTAIGRYLVRDIDVQDGRIVHQSSSSDERTLGNSQVVDASWPCILVFVSEWKTDDQLKSGDITQAIPKSIFMPDGRVVPICVVAAPKPEFADTDVNEQDLVYPVSAIGGGYPLLIDSQGLQKIASVGCIVTDGSKYYALTNKHVVGTPGTTVFTKFKNTRRKIGISTDKTIGNCKFETVYSDWNQSNLFLNVDVGLVEIDDINDWKTDIFGLGRLGKMIDLNTKNITLKLIGQAVEAHGAVSGNLKGAIAALFYRYKSVGGYEYVADFLIGPQDQEKMLNTHHGDSGTLWVVRQPNPTGAEEFLPLALQWGQRSVIDAGNAVTRSFVLASNLSNVCRDLDVEIVRGWNDDVDFTWGKTGHFKIGYAPGLVVGNNNLEKLLTLNADNLGISDSDLQKGNVSKAIFTEEFIPLADVPDMYWRTKRKADESNHFADMDAKHPSVFNNKSLLELVFKANGSINEAWLDVTKWLDFYQQMDDVDPEFDKKGRQRARLGGLPFRVWQMYNEMVTILKGRESKSVRLEKFLTAGGTMAHYIGDACQPLHISYLHDGYSDGSGAGVHSAYETKMLDMNRKKQNDNFLEAITGIVQKQKVKKTELVQGGRGAAERVLRLMRETYLNLPPKDIVDAYVESTSVVNLWENFGQKTIDTISNGIHTMAIIWQSAWVEGNGDELANAIEKFVPENLMSHYKSLDFVKSYKLNDLELQPLLV